MNKSNKEYEMLRQEILQYLNQYQTVRNMMYLFTVTILGFALTGQNANIYIFLLPLVIILPSYIISNDNWVAVNKAASYLVVYYESGKKCPYKWETLHRKFNEEFFTKKKLDLHRLPYTTCSVVCLLLFVLHIDYRKICNFETKLQFLIGGVAMFACIAVFKKYGKRKYEDFINTWKAVKERERGE